jgi:acetolactate synthase I/II/III large subunit
VETITAGEAVARVPGFEVQPDFGAIATACGCHSERVDDGERVDDADRVDEAVRTALRENERGRPAVLDFVVAPERVAGTLEHFTYYPALSTVGALG